MVTENGIQVKTDKICSKLLENHLEVISATFKVTFCYFLIIFHGEFSLFHLQFSTVVLHFCFS